MALSLPFPSLMLNLPIKRRMEKLFCNNAPQGNNNVFLVLHPYLPVQDARLIASKTYFFRLHYYQQLQLKSKTTTTKKQEYKRLVCVKINAEHDSPKDKWQNV